MVNITNVIFVCVHVFPLIYIMYFVNLVYFSMSAILLLSY